MGLDDGKTTSAMGLLGVGPEEVMGLGGIVASRRLVAVGLGRDGGGAGGHCQCLFFSCLFGRGRFRMKRGEERGKDDTWQPSLRESERGVEI